MKVGLCTCVLENKYSLTEAIRKAAEIGYKSYEIDIGIKPHYNEYSGDISIGMINDVEKIELIKKIASEVSIEINSLSLGVLWHYSLGAKNSEERKKAIKIVKDSIKFASSLGSRVILMVVGDPSGLDPKEARKNLIDSLKRCIEDAESNKVVLGVENVGEKIVYNVFDLIEVIDGVGSDFCQVYYDVGNATFIGLDPLEEILKLGEKIVQFHVKDILTKETKKMKIVNIGQGIVNYSDFLRTLKDIDYNGYLVIEVPARPESADDIARQNKSVIEQMIYTSISGK